MEVYGFLSFAKNISKNIGKNISKSLHGKYSQKLLDHVKQSATDALKTSWKRVIPKTSNATGGLIGNKIADKITTIRKTSPRNNSETNEEEILRERYIFQDKIIKTKNYWRLKINIIIIMIYNNNNGISKNNKLIRWYNKSTI